MWLCTLSVHHWQNWKFLAFFSEVRNQVPYKPVKPVPGSSYYYKFSPIGHLGRSPIFQSSGRSRCAIWLRLERKQISIVFIMFENILFYVSNPCSICEQGWLWQWAGGFSNNFPTPTKILWNRQLFFFTIDKTASLQRKVRKGRPTNTSDFH